MKHCNLCGNAVNGNEYRVFSRPKNPRSRGLTICADCQRVKPRCLVCQTPMPIERGKLGICVECLREGLRCRACGTRIRGEFLVVNSNDGPYCANCFRTLARCDLCGAPAGEGAVTYADGRVVCARCHQTAITDPAEAESMFERVIDILGDSLGMRLNIRPRLALVDHVRLAELARVSATEHGRNSNKVLGLFMRNGRKRFIYLQESLPRILLIQVAAHEFAHAWQGENCPLLNDPMLREGFAEWAAYHVLQELEAFKKASQMFQRPDDYGAGLRRCLEIEKRTNCAGVLEHCRAA